MQRFVKVFVAAIVLGLVWVKPAQVPKDHRSSQASEASNAPQPTASASQREDRNGRRPLTLALRRQWEPRQRAFSLLAPEGWMVDGGMFSVDPTRVGGAGNSIDTKCDLAVKRDPKGSVMARWLPSYNYVASHLSTLLGGAPARFRR